ncbi:hypothetical protein C8Q74DRAFT_1249870 [Fomes fomentarius]|nr:hypothetical protein C8Q74DRAFT_1249870 [Fomes fomentarius]
MQAVGSASTSSLRMATLSKTTGSSVCTSTRTIVSNRSGSASRSITPRTPDPMRASMRGAAAPTIQTMAPTRISTAPSLATSRSPLLQAVTVALRRLSHLALLLHCLLLLLARAVMTRIPLSIGTSTVRASRRTPCRAMASSSSSSLRVLPTLVSSLYGCVIVQTHLILPSSPSTSASSMAPPSVSCSMPFLEPTCCRSPFARLGWHTWVVETLHLRQSLHGCIRTS